MKIDHLPYVPTALHARLARSLGHGLCVGATLFLAACGGGSDVAPTTDAATTSTTLSLDPVQLPEEAAALVAEPTFHAAPVLLDAPDDSDAIDNGASARRGPHLQALSADLADLPTRGLTLQTLQATQRLHALGASGSTGDGSNVAIPLAGGSAVATYTPAQIRAAYGLPALPVAGATLSAAQAARLGAGQTIYIVDAMHDPNVVAELAAFNARFGLPTCTTKAVAATASLPLAAASATAGCEIAVVYSTTAGGLTASAPAYDAGWATEIALDVQWAHATAPLARIVLIEAASASLDNLVGAVKLANAMGPGVVSMSFGAKEGSYTASVDAAFGAANMSYLAATGDSGAGVSWPAVSTRVLAVGGTTLSYAGTGSRTEVAWSGTGGGISAYTATPSYQSAAVPGMGTAARRTVADVAFNADPSSGQYTAVQPKGSSSVAWMSIGGTSLATPQWAGLLAVANAVRAASAKAALGAPHAALYTQIASVPGTYASTFGDVVSGSHGSCATCRAKTGYDELTGLGTPNAGALLDALGGTTTASTGTGNGGTGTGTTKAGPVITAAAMTGVVGKALSGSIAVADPGVTSLSISISGAPAGMSFAASGLTITANWPAPVAGSYSLKVSVLDSAGLTATASVPITINAR